jgi:dTDP-4-amino-4,6-dideoxygalactose transaminase
MVDVLEDTFNLDPDQLGKAVSGRTRAIVPVHLFGQCADMDRIMRFAKRHDLRVIEDNAQAIGADHASTGGQILKGGTIGHVGITSFFPSKNLGAFGDGGALFTRDGQLAARLRSLTNHGMGSQKYYYDQVGVNSRLDTLQAAILRVKLRYLNQYHAARQRAATWYDNALGGLADVRVPVRSTFSTHIFHQYTIRVPSDSRDSLKQWLHGKGIPSMVYYPVPLHLQKAYGDLGYGKGDLPVSEKLSGEVLSLPMHTELDEEQLSYICKQIQAFF